MKISKLTKLPLTLGGEMFDSKYKHQISLGKRSAEILKNKCTHIFSSSLGQKVGQFNLAI